MIVETAPAKINLYLHVGSVRNDGLHELASLFVFTEKGDRIFVEPASDLSLEINGPFSSLLTSLAPAQNLVWRAAAFLKEECNVAGGAKITLEKNLPIASGVGGGSADAAAALRALIKLWDTDISQEALAALAFKLGADIPACLHRAPANVGGAGEQIAPGPLLPPLWTCLVNPGVDMPTGPIFRAFDAARPDPVVPRFMSVADAAARGYEALIAALRETRNDLEPFARKLAPEIDAVLATLAASPGVLMTRMSGSGATCFGLFASAQTAFDAEKAARQKGWWALASGLHVR